MSIINDDTLNLFQQAIDIESKNFYIDIKGHHDTFSSFIKKQLMLLYRKSEKDRKWLTLINTFEKYNMDSLPGRKSAIKALVKCIKNEIEKPSDIINKTKIPRTLELTDVTYIKGVGPKISYIFNKLGIFTAYDLITYYPKKHINYSSRTLIRNLKEDENVSVYATIHKVSAYNTRSGLGVINLLLADESGTMPLSFFYGKASKTLLERYKSQFPKDASILISGKVKRDKYTGKLTIDKTEHQIIAADFCEEDKKTQKNLNLGRIVPIYALTENLNIKTLRKAIYSAITEFKEEITDVLPDYLKERYNFLDKKEAISQIHFPDTEENIEKARMMLVYEELFLFQLRYAIFRKKVSDTVKSKIIKTTENGLVQKFISGLPFELTNAQKNAIREILSDLNSEKPMQRLLQGDVGSGKTVVACIMLLSAIENGYQTALMAPTEILAQQHYINFSKWLNPYHINIGLFIGSNKTAQKKKIERDLINGQIDIAIGTHALLQENVEFNNLGVIVIDEQHRFGVQQRSTLKAKGEVPQMLTMTATPIPRTLSLTMHGDLDLSIIDEMPKGRKPIITKLLSSNTKKEVYKLITEQIQQSHQVYIVYPLIDESETLSAKAATAEYERLSKEIFPNYKIGLLHGKLKNEEKEIVMDSFKNGEYDILVSTTVVEVGVDVPNATVIIIENAERFGLSQLHQLRGRVGRSDLQSYCILISSSKNPDTRERLHIMEETNNGFIIAEKDLQLRGPGEFLGIRQSGLPDFAIADIAKDTQILEQARNDAFEFVKTKNIDDFPELKKEMANKYQLNPYLLKID